MPTRSRASLLAVLLLLLCAGGVPAPAQTSIPPLIDVKVTGTGKPPIVFIPGLACPGSVWDETVAEFSKTNTCYVVSVAGFGGMPASGKHARFLPDVRDALIDYLRAHRVEHPVIVGHSLGGALALDLASAAPELPVSLVIVDSLPFLAALINARIKTESDAHKLAESYGAMMSGQTPEQFAAGQKLFVSSMVTDPAKAAAIAAQTGKSDPATTGQAMTELMSRDLRQVIGKITCPVLVLGALADKVDADTSRESIEKAYHDQYANAPQTRFEFFGQARHFIMNDDPVGFDAVLRKELATP